MMAILLSGNDNLFGENLVAGLKSIRKVLDTLLSQLSAVVQQAEVDREKFLSIESMLDLFTICHGMEIDLLIITDMFSWIIITIIITSIRVTTDHVNTNIIDLLQAILATRQFSIPKVTELNSSSSSSSTTTTATTTIRSKRVLHQLVVEEERKYTESLIDEAYQLLDTLNQLRSTTQITIPSNQTTLGHLHIHSKTTTIQTSVMEMENLVQSLLSRFQTELLELPSIEHHQSPVASKQTNMGRKKEVTQEAVFKAIQLFTKDMRSPLEPIRSLAVNRFDHLVQNAKTGRI